MDFLTGIVARIARLMAIMAGIALLAIIAIIMTDVATRLVGISLAGSLELVRTTFVVSVFFAFAHVILSEREIRVDVMRFVLPAPLLRCLDVAAGIVTLCFFGLLAWFSTTHFIDTWTRGIFMDGELLLPMWMPWGTIVIGSVAAVVAAICLIARAALQPVRTSDPTEISAATRQVV